MKQLPRIAARLYCEPWNILPTNHAEIGRQFRAHLEAGGALPAAFAARTELENAADDLTGPAWRDEEGRVGAFHTQVTVEGTTAILPIRGVLGKHLSTLEMYCGGSDYAIISQQAANIAADPRIDRVIMLIDSPGGNCVGNLECARSLLAMAGVKDTVAYTDTMACSAAYFLASAAGAFIAAPSALVGSISTYCAYLDESRAYEMEGVEVKMFRSGEVKGAGYPGKPWTEAEMVSMQAVTDSLAVQFKGFVRERRGLPDSAMQGQYWPADSAPEGVIDDMADSLAELLQRLG